jgi:hypothetical protein
MKLTSLVCFVLIFVGTSYSQEIDQRLLPNYDHEELETMIATDPEKYALLIYALDNALYVSNYSSAKGGQFESIVVDPDALPTFLELNLEIMDQNQYFKIEGFDKLLVVKSTWVLNHEMQKK